LEWQIGEFEQRTNIQCSFKSNVEDVELNADRATALFRILQESLTNVVRHAHATSVQVSLTVSGGRIELTIHDNGKGISEVEISDQHSSLTELEEQYPKSLGILGMSERAGLLGGTVVIKGVAGEGTTVTVELPLLAGAVT
jgi:signal transduction histidine kinase